MYYKIKLFFIKKKTFTLNFLKKSNDLKFKIEYFSPNFKTIPMNAINTAISKTLAFIKIALLPLLLCFFNIALGQFNTLNIQRDSLLKPTPLNISVEDIATSRLKESKATYENNQTVRKQNITFNLITAEIQKANRIIKQGIDYKGFTREIELLVQWNNFAVDGITTNKHKVQSSRNLTTTTIFLGELFRRTENQLSNIKANNKALSNIQKNLDSLASDNVLYQTPQDSVAKENYFQKLILLTKDITTTNNILKNAIDSIQSLEIKGSVFKYNLESDIAEINLLRKQESDQYHAVKSPVFDSNEISFIKSLHYSLKKGYLVLIFYIVNHESLFILLLSCILSIGLYLRVLKRKYIDAKIYQKFKYPIQIFNQPFLIATFITLSIFQLFIQSPPFIFTALIWLISLLVLTLIIKKSNSKPSLYTWLIYLGLILLVLLDNLILVKTNTETIFILCIGIASTLFGIYRIRNRNKIFIFNTPTLWIISLMLAFEVIGLYTLVSGYYNMSKLLITVGIVTIIIGYLSIYTYQFILDIIHFSEYLIEKDTQKNINTIAKENHEVTKLYYIIFAVSWIILVNRNTYSFQNFIDPFLLAFTEEQTIGAFSFSYSSFLIFFLVLLISSFVSKLVSFLTYEQPTNSKVEKSKSIGSWILLIRIGIFSLGIIVAFASAGIPMDRIGIIISVLGVGIGFGLQSIVNNLVSGLIIAFEKPVNIDDIIEIGGQTGTMKSIGIRSSVVTTWDGADIIIPNGDILNQHMTNWTMGSTKRRFEISVGVAYGTDLKMAKSIIKEILDGYSLILKNPEPVIWVTQFGDSSIDFVIKFWVPHYNYGNDVKSDLIMDIDEQFKLNDITIPFPQQDVYIKSIASKENNPNSSEQTHLNLD